MFAYIARRLLFMIPTLFGILLINFGIVQFAPGGPVERVLAQLQGLDAGATAHFGGGGETGNTGAGTGDMSSKYRGAQGLDPKFIAELEKQFGFDKPAYERFFLMLKNYATFDFGRSYFRDVPVWQLIKEKLARFDFARTLDDAFLLCDLDSLGHQEGGQRWFALRYLDLGRRHHGLCDPELSLRDSAHRAFLRRLLLADFSAARPHLGKLAAAFACPAKSPIISGTSPCPSCR